MNGRFERWFGCLCFACPDPAAAAVHYHVYHVHYRAFAFYCTDSTLQSFFILHALCSSVQHFSAVGQQQSRCFWFGSSAAPPRVLLLLLLLLVQVQTGMSAPSNPPLLLPQHCCAVKRAKHGCEGHIVARRRTLGFEWGTFGRSSKGQWAGGTPSSFLSRNQEKEARSRWVGLLGALNNTH